MSYFENITATYVLLSLLQMLRCTWVLGVVGPPVELGGVVGRVGLPGDGVRPAVRQGAPHLLVLGLLERAVHAVELRRACRRGQQGAAESQALRLQHHKSM